MTLDQVDVDSVWFKPYTLIASPKVSINPGAR